MNDKAIYLQVQKGIGTRAMRFWEGAATWTDCPGKQIRLGVGKASFGHKKEKKPFVQPFVPRKRLFLVSRKTLSHLHDERERLWKQRKHSYSCLACLVGFFLFCFLFVFVSSSS
jgi:hypothetical protein